MRVFIFIFFPFPIGKGVFRSMDSHRPYKICLKINAKMCVKEIQGEICVLPQIFLCGHWAQKRPSNNALGLSSVAGPAAAVTGGLTWMLSCLLCSALCSSRRLPLRVLSFTASCSASSFVWALPSRSRFSLWTESSDKATTFCSISTSMFWSNRNEDDIHTPCGSHKDPFTHRNATPPSSSLEDCAFGVFPYFSDRPGERLCIFKNSLSFLIFFSSLSLGII